MFTRVSVRPIHQFTPAARRYAAFLQSLGEGDTCFDPEALIRLEQALPALHAASLLLPADLEDALDLADRQDWDWRGRAAHRLVQGSEGVPAQWQLLWKLWRLAHLLPG